jgi:glycosyltransferase involved in cell wall biosynthesis
MGEPIVSVIIPAYNASRFIAHTIESALQQSFRDLEVIIVDDGSTDETPAIAQAYVSRDSRVKLLRQDNTGVAAARNLGIRQSRGTFIAPLDADDVWSPHKLEEQVARMEAGGPGMGMVYSWWAGIDELDAPTGVSQTWAAEGALYGLLLFTNFIGNASVPLFRRSTLNEVGYYSESFRRASGEGCEDWDLSLRLAERSQVGVAKGYHIGYREVSTSMSGDTDQMARSFELVWEAARDRTPDIPARIHRWSAGTFYLYLASQAHRSRDNAGTRKWLLKAARQDPIGMVGRWYWKRLVRAALPLGSEPNFGQNGTPDSLSLAAIAAPEQLEPYVGKWWKIYARTRYRRAEWAKDWSETRWAQRGASKNSPGDPRLPESH